VTNTDLIRIDVLFNADMPVFVRLPWIRDAKRCGKMWKTHRATLGK
jgi:hypothetical protein